MKMSSKAANANLKCYQCKRLTGKESLKLKPRFKISFDNGKNWKRLSPKQK